MLNKRICIIAPSLQMGGLERSLSTLANYFVTQNHEIFFVTTLSLPSFFELDPRIHLINPPLAFNRQRSLIDSIVYYTKIFSPYNGYLRSTIREIKPDVILSFGDVLPQICMLSLAGLNIPFYLSNRSTPNIKYPPHIKLFRTLGYLLGKPTGVIAQTQAAAKRKQQILGKNFNIRIIPNPVRSVDRFDISKQNWIVSVGRLHHEKGFDRLIQAFSLINSRNWKLVFAGSGKHEPDIRNLVKKLNLDNKIIFLGKVENIDKLLAECKIFVLPSYGEGFPNALCEAMSAGLACVSFDIVAGPGDVIADGVNGYLVPDNNIQELARKMQYLIDNEEECVRIGNNAMSISDSHSIEEIGNRYLNFILEKV